MVVIICSRIIKDNDIYRGNSPYGCKIRVLQVIYGKKWLLPISTSLMLIYSNSSTLRLPNRYGAKIEALGVLLDSFITRPFFKKSGICPLGTLFGRGSVRGLLIYSNSSALRLPNRYGARKEAPCLAGGLSGVC